MAEVPLWLAVLVPVAAAFLLTWLLLLLVHLLARSYAREIGEQLRNDFLSMPVELHCACPDCAGDGDEDEDDDSL